MVDYRGPQFLKDLCQRLQIDWFDRVIWMEFNEFKPQHLNDLHRFSHLERISWPAPQIKDDIQRQLHSDFGDQLYFLGSRSESNFYPNTVMLEFRGDVLEAQPNVKPIFRFDRATWEELNELRDKRQPETKINQFAIIK